MLSGPLGWGATAARGLLLGGSVLGTALSAYEFPQLMVMDLAAKASVAGGEKLTHQTPEEARMNLALGYANLAIAPSIQGLQPFQADDDLNPENSEIDPLMNLEWTD
jgi:hypothetical protein